ncbi:hypothetical protein BABINDRAFT_183058 [Babjeviella inositovora NRRL Y-12698]|uniref:Uncharacterized protein n=1 Tax=Babjeviella inositovora NRRL Y-12698 TaxID=984486 RepID=A0A1E3QUD3_9ASCO|nr:uncharacterized protein BABINDRAFT_183058 [Babjeviella inositovora NRRL Y-12698]ODQ81296.1 hypothetical protein BABINDRAFT_183058 [Babjeviella inositovora NRRL Y-12698]
MRRSKGARTLPDHPSTAGLTVLIYMATLQLRMVGRHRPGAVPTAALIVTTSGIEIAW